MKPAEPRLPAEPVARLKAGTDDLHIRLDRHSSMSRLLATDLTLGEYAGILLRLLACHLEFEPVIEDFRQGSELTPDWLSPAIYRRSADLRADLQALGCCSSWDEIVDKNRNRKPSLEIGSQAQAAGVMYVLAGAGLGARLIQRRLREQLGQQVEPALRYFSPPADGIDWSAYREALNRALCGDEEEADALRGARAVFDCFLRHLQIEPAPEAKLLKISEPATYGCQVALSGN